MHSTQPGPAEVHPPAMRRRYARNSQQTDTSCVTQPISGHLSTDRDGCLEGYGRPLTRSYHKLSEQVRGTGHLREARQPSRAAVAINQVPELPQTDCMETSQFEPCFLRTRILPYWTAEGAAHGVTYGAVVSREGRKPECLEHFTGRPSLVGAAGLPAALCCPASPVRSSARQHQDARTPTASTMPAYEASIKPDSSFVCFTLVPVGARSYSNGNALTYVTGSAVLTAPPACAENANRKAT